MITRKFFDINSDKDLITLLPLIGEHSQKTSTSFSSNLREIVRTMEQGVGILHMVFDGDTPVAYCFGYPLTDTIFFVAQNLSKSPKLAKGSWKMMERHLLDLGVKKILIHTELHPRVFEKYGFRFNRYILEKELSNDIK